jgi:hypothetical protein
VEKCPLRIAKKFSRVGLITYFGTAGLGKLKFGGQTGNPGPSTAHAESDPNYFRV